MKDPFEAEPQEVELTQAAEDRIVERILRALRQPVKEPRLRMAKAAIKPFSELER